MRSGRSSLFQRDLTDSDKLRIADCGSRIERPTRDSQFAIRNLALRALINGGLLLVVFAAFAQARGAEEIDRLLLAVNGKVITEGDLFLARNLNAILSLGQTSPLPSRQREIDRLVDLELMRQELSNFPMAPEDQSKIQTRMQEIKNACAGIGGLPDLLSRLGLQETELLDYVRLQDSILRFVDFRFRPFAGVSDQEIQDYYNEKLVPPLRKAGAPVPPLTEVSGKIEEILKEEKVNALMSQWIRDVRSHSRIEYFDRAELPWENKR